MVALLRTASLKRLFPKAAIMSSTATTAPVAWNSTPGWMFQITRSGYCLAEMLVTSFVWKSFVGTRI